MVSIASAGKTMCVCVCVCVSSFAGDCLAHTHTHTHTLFFQLMRSIWEIINPYIQFNYKVFYDITKSGNVVSPTSWGRHSVYTSSSPKFLLLRLELPLLRPKIWITQKAYRVFWYRSFKWLFKKWETACVFVWRSPYQ